MQARDVLGRKAQQAKARAEREQVAEEVADQAPRHQEVAGRHRALAVEARRRAAEKPH